MRVWVRGLCVVAAVAASAAEKRGIAASGHETTDTDPGSSTTKDDYSLESSLRRCG
jgi:hypothetical protein